MSVEDEQGWVPSTCLEREDGVKEDTTQKFKPGEGNYCNQNALIRLNTIV